MSETPRIVFLDASTIDGGDLDLDPLLSLGDLKIHQTTEPDQVAERIAGADIVLTNKVALDADALADADKLVLIVVTATGVNNIDLDTARAQRIVVCNVAGYSTPSVAQHTIGLLLNLATNTHRYAAEAQLWPESPIFTRLAHPITELDGKRLGIAGAGRIGCRVAEIATTLGMEVQFLARSGSLTARHPEWPRLDAEAFYGSSDAISLHCPLTEETRHMICGSTLRRMKTSALLINTGHGDLVNEVALGDALRSHSIAGAALDVLSPEPPPADHPLLATDIPNLLLTPHTAWQSIESRRRLLDGVAHNIRSFLIGHPDNRVV